MGNKQSGQLNFKKIWPIKQRKTKNNVANEIFFFIKTIWSIKLKIYLVQFLGTKEEREVKLVLNSNPKGNY